MPRASRAAENERVLRDVNDRIRELEERLGGAGGDYRASFVCECYRPDCHKLLSLTLAEYGAVRAIPTQFLVLPGHVDPALERVVRQTDRYGIVEKLDAPP